MWRLQRVGLLVFCENLATVGQKGPVNGAVLSLLVQIGLQNIDKDSLELVQSWAFTYLPLEQCREPSSPNR